MASAACLRPYVPPPWVSKAPLLAAAKPPLHRLPGLANLPTPIVRWDLPPHLLPPDFRLWIKRDDATGSELSGNKVRKLQFLMADALNSGADCVVTIGGVQSNHARATALAARAIGLEPHLVLRTDTPPAELGLAGNLLLNRLAGAKIWLATMQDYVQSGSDALVNRVVQALQAAGRQPYAVPLGGSNGLGTWGYLDAVQELESQMGKDQVPEQFTDIAMATGSGGTTGGIGIGVSLSSLSARVHGFSTSDSPDYFYNHIDKQVIRDIAGNSTHSVPSARDLVHLRDVKGIGYAKSTTEELEFIRDVAAHSGVVLDHVYSGKAFRGLLKLMREEPSAFKGRDVLFWHTGGIFGVFDKESQIAPLLSPTDVQMIPARL